MGWIDVESVGLFCPDFADVFVWGQAVEGLQTAREIVGVDEVAEVAAEMIVGLVVEPLDRCFLDGPVHPLDLTVGPGVPGFGEAMIDVGLGAGQFEPVRPEPLTTFYRQPDLGRG